MPIRQPIERHRRTAGEDHAQQNAGQLQPVKAATVFHASAALVSANGSAKRVWLKRISSSSERNERSMTASRGRSGESCHDNR